jgi:hypothetical protein
MKQCSECGSTTFYEGPSGGLSTNFCCENGHWFNDMGPFGVQKIADKGYLPCGRRPFVPTDVAA